MKVSGKFTLFFFFFFSGSSLVPVISFLGSLQYQSGPPSTKVAAHKIVKVTGRQRGEGGV